MALPDKSELELLLSRPFAAEDVSQRPGSGKKSFSYVDGEKYYRRVLEVGAYDWEIISTSFQPGEKYQYRDKRTGEIIEMERRSFFRCIGRLTIPGLGHRDGEGTQVWENEDSPKGAETDAFKRAAMKFGVGLELYEKEPQQRANSGVGSQTRHPGNAVDNPERRMNTSETLCPECYAPSGKLHGTGCKS